MLVKVYPARPLDPPIELSDQSVMVGRDESCKIHISADSVSRQHAELTCDAGRWTIRDLDSTNGSLTKNRARPPNCVAVTGCDLAAKSTSS
jgi:pSer/pThr/pTyr-binding forkhead associated (FHA) protein